jgi:hypothetical protein
MEFGAVNRCFVDPIVWSGLVGDGESSKLPVVPDNIIGENRTFCPILATFIF